MVIQRTKELYRALQQAMIISSWLATMVRNHGWFTHLHVGQPHKKGVDPPSADSAGAGSGWIGDISETGWHFA